MVITLGDSLATLPSLPPTYVSRPRLLADLERAADLPLTLLCAGPGAGKTVLLTEWVQGSRTRAAWIVPDAAVPEPGHLLNLLESAPADLPDAPLAVVIDDAHMLTNPDILDGIDRLVRSRRPGLRLVLAARSDPPLPLHRYRLAGQMAELRAAELALTTEEVRKVLAAHEVSLPDRDVDVLAARTEGWAAGVRLSAMRMAGSERPADLVSQLALDTGSIGEYLLDEVLARLPGDHRRLLIETSFLDEVTGPLADAVTKMTGSDDILAGLARDNSFVIALDPMRTRYRYHHLFREILRYLLRRRGRAAVSLRQERAAAWFESDGDLGSAVRWAVQAGDGPRVTSLLARGGLAHALVHRLDLSGLRLRDLVPSPEPGPEPADSAVAAFAVEAILATPETAAGELAGLRAWRDEQAPTDRDLRLTCDLAELLLGQKGCDDRAVDDAAARILATAGDAGSPVNPGLRAAVLLAQAAAHLWHGTHTDVVPLLDEAAAEARRDGKDGLELEALSMMACHDSLWLRAHRAEETLQRAHAMRESRMLGVPPALELAAAVRALFSGDLAAQARAARRIVLTGAVGADPALGAASALVVAGGLFARGHRAEAQTILHQQADRVVPAALSAYRDVMLADFETFSGRPRSALALLDRDRRTEFTPVIAPAAGRAHLALNDLRAARDRVRDALASPSAQVSRFTLVDALLCEARISAASDTEGRALEILARALDVARGEVVLPFLCVAGAFADLLARHPDVASQWPAGPGAGAVSLPVPAPRVPRDPLDPLTPRELTILRLLATTMSTAEIAAELCLSVNTIKTHLAAIYRKLPASRRREAVLRARDLELI